MDWVGVAAGLGLDPQRVIGKECRVRCPAGCDDGRKGIDYGASMQAQEGLIACYRCEGGWAVGALARGQELPEAPARRPEPPPVQIDPLDVGAAWAQLRRLHQEHAPSIERWAVARGWPAEVAWLVATSREVAWAPPAPVEGVEGERLRRLCYGADGRRPLLVALRDEGGRLVSAQRRAVDRAASPKAKLLPTAATGAQGLRALGNLPAAADLADDGGGVLIVEGEVDCLAAQALCDNGLLPGLAAVLGAPSRAGLRALAEALSGRLPRGALVVVCPDLGDGGREGVRDAGERDMLAAGALIAQGGARVVVWRLPLGADGRADLAQVLEEQGVEVLQGSLARALAAGEPPSGGGGGGGAGDEDGGAEGAPLTRHWRLTDIGNAERLRDRFGASLRYSPQRGRWLLWDGGLWRPDAPGDPGAQELAKTSARQIWEEEGADLEALRKHAKRSESAGAVRAALQLASSDPALRVEEAALDADPWLMGVQGGQVLDLRTGQARAATRGDLITRRSGVAWDPGATCPRWERLLGELFVGDDGAPDRDLIAYLKRAVGYSLTGSTREQEIFVLLGYGANGKSTFLDAITAIAGDYAKTADFRAFLEQSGDGPRNDIAALAGARLVTASEPDDRKRLDEALLKSITGGEVITARFLHREFFEFRPQLKLWLSANHKPQVKGTDEGIWRRLRLVPFGVTFREEGDPKEGPRKDRALPERLRAELPGILRWAVEGALEWQAGGLRTPERVRVASREWQTEMDTVGSWLADEVVGGAALMAPADQLYRSYRAWCEEQGHAPRSQTRLGLDLVERGYTKSRGAGGRVVYGGLGLRVR